jgi:D-alanyl-D-alanine carboxypeptidase (penicillin-binding protein 5/6)
MLRLILAAFVLALTAAPAMATDAILDTPAKQAYMIDYQTGTVLFEKNADERMPTSSMSKAMSIYLIFDALKKNQLKLDDTFLVSEKAWKKEGSKMFVEVDKRVGVEDLIRGVIIQSGNDATIVLAEGLSGSEDAFAAALNAKAKELGMTNSNFANASGWPDPNHYSTAKDLATLSAATITNFPQYYPYYAEKEFTFNNIKQTNRNPLLYRNMGVDGIKTGHTEDGGYGLMASGVTPSGRRVILVVNGLADETARAQESARLLEWGMNGFENRTLVKAGTPVEQSPVVMGQAENIPLTIEKDITLTIPKIAQQGLKAEVTYASPLIAPIAKGQEVGKLVVTVTPTQQIIVPLVAERDVPALGFLAATFSKMKLLVTGG